MKNTDDTNAADNKRIITICVQIKQLHKGSLKENHPLNIYLFIYFIKPLL